MKNLEILNISNVGKVQSLAPLIHLKKLKALACFGDTNIVDGDLSYLEKLPQLALLGCPDRRHYTHKVIREWNWKNIDQPDILIKKK